MPKNGNKLKAKPAPAGPKTGPKVPKKPEVTYVYRKDAFNKVKLA